jgi:serine/threonine-protein kinase
VAGTRPSGSVAGRLTDADFRAEREKWAQDTAAKTPPRLAALGWFFFYAGTAETASDAREALEALPRYSPLFTFDGMVYNERVMGRVLQLVGRLDEAIPHLRRAVASCFSPDSFPSHQWAARTLGEALEAKGDTKGACDAFGEVLAHWGNAKPRSITADAARAHMKKLGCAR